MKIKYILLVFVVVFCAGWNTDEHVKVVCSKVKNVTLKHPKQNVTFTYGVVAAMADFYRSWGDFEKASEKDLKAVRDYIQKVVNGESISLFTKVKMKAREIDIGFHNKHHFQEKSRAIKKWRQMHDDAVRNARKGDDNYALLINAFADHYLADCFAAGHISVPRQTLKRELRNLKAMKLHDYFNKHGLPVYSMYCGAWTVYGDGYLHVSYKHRKLTKNALKSSANDILSILAGKGLPKFCKKNTHAKYEAEKHVPVLRK